MDIISLPHKRQDDDEAKKGVLAADIKGPLPKNRRLNSWLLAALARLRPELRSFIYTPVTKKTAVPIKA